MRDRDIRAALLKQLRQGHEGDAETLIIEELGLCEGEARVDLAVVNGLLSGFEIKSERDTLDRLAGQLAIYGRALDCLTIVAASIHLKAVMAAVPEWCGIIEARADAKNGIRLVNVREGGINPSIEPYAVAQLLWRDEVLATLRSLDMARGVLSRPRRILWERLAERVPLEQLGDIVRAQLKARVGWRPVQPQSPGGESSPPGATS